MNFTIARGRVWRAALVAALAVGCAGRDQKVREVRGTVSYKGEPLQSGTVRAVGPNNEVAFAVVQGDGSYILTDVPAGEVKIGVQQGNEPRSVGDSSGKKADKAARPAVVLPQKYYDPETSGVTRTITHETTTLDIDFP
jgi:hypothetical protein